MILSNEAHFVRYCKNEQVQEDEVIVAAFRLRKGEVGLSGDHYEHFQNNNYLNILNALKKRYKGVEKNGYFIKLNCGNVISALSSNCNITFGKALATDSHTEMLGLNNDYAFLLQPMVEDIQSISKL
jgi:hypothetical protein